MSMPPGPKNLRHVLLGLALGGLLAAGALALTWPDAAPAPPPATAEDPDAAGEHNMSADARCAHMPEHCAEDAR